MQVYRRALLENCPPSAFPDEKHLLLLPSALVTLLSRLQTGRIARRGLWGAQGAWRLANEKRTGFFCCRIGDEDYLLDSIRVYFLRSPIKRW